MKHVFFFSIYYDSDDYASMELEDQVDHIRDEMEVRSRTLSNADFLRDDNKAREIMVEKLSLVDHYCMIINLKKNHKCVDKAISLRVKKDGEEE